jgi:Kef-type K+ transport system membrane component KefB
LPELPIEDVISQFTLVFAAALVVQLAFERTRVPGLIGLILLGMAIGPGGAAILPEEPVVELFGAIGLLYIMFIGVLSSTSTRFASTSPRRGFMACWPLP